MKSFRLKCEISHGFVENLALFRYDKATSTPLLNVTSIRLETHYNYSDLNRKPDSFDRMET